MKHFHSRGMDVLHNDKFNEDHLSVEEISLFLSFFKICNAIGTLKNLTFPLRIKAMTEDVEKKICFGKFGKLHWEIPQESFCEYFEYFKGDLFYRAPIDSRL